MIEKWVEFCDQNNRDKCLYKNTQNMRVFFLEIFSKRNSQKSSNIENIEDRNHPVIKIYG